MELESGEHSCHAGPLWVQSKVMTVRAAVPAFIQP